MAKKKEEIWEDKWVKTHCGGCYACCHCRVRVVNGVAVKIEGEPDTYQGAKGGLCGKGVAEIQMLYDPNRINYPLKRTNPEKGLGVDPKWKRISWEEAYSEIAEKLIEVRKDNPLKILGIGGPGHGAILAYFQGMACFINALGSPMTNMGGGGLQCGSGSHLTAGMNHCSWSVLPDFKHCNYAVYFGATKGTGAGHSAGMTMRQAAEARSRGMKMVAFDPICNFAGGKAREWIPIIPGTDGIVALSMANLLLNELGIYDKEYLEKKTNAPYLVRPDGKYARDDRDEPMLWDIEDNQPKPWDDPTLKATAIEGSYDVGGVACRPALALLKEHLKQYSPEKAEEVSTVPANTIRRVAKELGDAACIGSTIDIEGVKLPYRPVACIMFRGGEGHSNSFHSYVSVDLLNHILGACEVPGGATGWGGACHAKGEGVNMDYEPIAVTDGFLRATSWPTVMPAIWPHDKPKAPFRLDMLELFTAAAFPVSFFTQNIDEIWDKFPLLNYRPEVVFTAGTNCVLTAANVDATAEFLKKVPFQVDINIYPSETNEGFADLLLPDTHWLESWDAWDGELFFFNSPTGMEDWSIRHRQPVIPPMHERKNFFEMLEELAHRTGTSRWFHALLNWYLSTTGGEGAFMPEGEAFLPMEKFTDTWIKSRFGSDHGIDWFFKDQDATVQWKKKPEEVYWRWFVPARSTVCYHEYLIEQKEDTEKILSPVGIPMDWEQYTPFPSYFLTVPLKSTAPEYDLVFISTRDVLHTGTSSGYMPWIIEASEMNPLTAKVAMNVRVAEQKGLKDGDIIWIENDRGSKVKGSLRAVEGIHPKVVAITGFGGGRFVRGAETPQKLGGILTNRIIPTEWGDFCPVCLNLETSAKVRVFKDQNSGGKQL